MPEPGPVATRLAGEAGQPGGARPPATASVPGGTVTGAPRRWLRLEGAVLLAGSLIAYHAAGQAWWPVPLAVLAPDLLMAGYVRGTRLGAQLYNAGHSTLLPAAVAGLAWWQGQPLILALGLIWLAHIGLDRLLGYGLKYDDDFQHTHLSIQRAADGPQAQRGTRP
jgi:hypothetical protein